MSTEFAQAHQRGLTGDRGRLLEREAELDALAERLAAARRGEGGVTLIEAPAGVGKTRLLASAAAMARDAGMRVLQARGDELEREFQFGVAIQLFDAELRDAASGARAYLLGGPAQLTSGLMGTVATDPGSLPRERGYALIHGVFWLARNLAVLPDGEVEARPLVLIVDDVHWADWPSLRFLVYLAERLSALPIALIVAARAGEASVDRAALEALRKKTLCDDLLRPASLSAGAAAELTQAAFPQAASAFVEACVHLTAGNPFLLIELLSEVRRRGTRPDERTAERLAELTPRVALDRVASRLAMMGPEATALAGAIAVIGGDAPLRQAALVAYLDIDTTLRAADALASVHVFRPGTPLGFVHPVVGAAVRAAMSNLRRGELHRRAAAVLAREHAPVEQVAEHLLAAPPAGDEGTVRVLRAAADKATASDAPALAARMLERAVAEGPGRSPDPDLLAELGHAELAAGLPTAIDRLQHAIEITEEPARRAGLALVLGRALHGARRYEEAADVLGAALDELDERDAGLAAELEAAYVAVATFVPALRHRARARGQAMLARIGRDPSTVERAALAHLGIQSALRNEDRASVAQIAEQAWSDGALLDAEHGEGMVWPLLAGALLFVDELERSLEICDGAVDASGTRSAARVSAAASYCRAWGLYHRADVAGALAQAQASVAAGSEGWYDGGLSAYGALAACQLQRDELDQAERTLSILNQPAAVEEVELPVLLEVRAQLRLAQLRADDALSDAIEAGRRCLLGRGDVGPGVLAWRSTAALAHLALGEPAAATRLARQELDLARASGVTRVIIRDLRVLGLAERGARGLSLLEEAVAEGADYPARLEYIHALMDLGAAQRRDNRRSDARGPLRRALELAHRGGCRRLAEEARRELNATGARPRRAVLSGPDALTPSERRVADLAVRGLTTRQISEALYVSPKTVEFHLRQIYRKLEVSSSRAELIRALSPDGVEHPSKPS